MKAPRKSRAASTRKSATTGKRPMKDLRPRQAPTGGTLGDGSVRFVKDGLTTTVWR